MSATLRPPRVPRSWDARFLRLAREVAAWSKDPSTSVGAVAVRERRVLATGYNGLPQHVLDSPARLLDRDARLAMTIHAEVNLIAYAARHGVCLAGSTIYVWPLMSCSQCAAALIQIGASRLVVPDYVEPLRWQESFDRARAMLAEAGVALVRVSMDTGQIEDAESSPASGPEDS